VVWSNLWGWLFFSEPLTPASGAGAALIVAGVLVVTLPGGRQQPAPDQQPRPEPERVHSLLHKLLVRCPQCGVTEQGWEDEEGAAAGAGAGAGRVELCFERQQAQKQLLLGGGFTMSAAGGVPVIGQLGRAPLAAQVLSEALAGGEACTGRSVQPGQAAAAAAGSSAAAAAAGPSGGPPLMLCRTCSCGLQAEDRMYSARSSFVTRSSSEFSIGSWAPAAAGGRHSSGLE
jgi:hypothetical protein